MSINPITINIKDDSRFADVAYFVDRSDFLADIENLRKKWKITYPLIPQKNKLWWTFPWTSTKRQMQKYAAKQLGITVRQVQRITGRYRKEGVAGLIHKSRGRISNRAIPDEKEKEIISLIKKYYSDFGPTLACEKLEAIHNLSFSDETIRKIMTEGNLWLPKKKKIKDI